MPSASNAGVTSPRRATSGRSHWYRKDFRLPTGVAVLEVDAALRVGQLPGEGVAERQAARSSRRRRICPFELRAKSVQPARREPPRGAGRQPPQKFDIPPLSQRATGAFEGGWWNYNGILREVYLRKVDQLDFAERVLRAAPALPHAVRPPCSCDARVAQRQLRRRARPASPARSAAGRCASAATASAARGTARFRARLRIAQPAPVEPERPALYTRQADRCGRRAAGRCSATRVHTGIRTLRVSRLGRIQLNGRDVNLRGASMPRGLPSRGAALTPDADAAEHRATCASWAPRSRARTTRCTPTRWSWRTATGSWSGRRSRCSGWQSRLFDDLGGPQQGAAHAARGDRARLQPSLGGRLEHRQRERLATGHRPAQVHPQGRAHGRRTRPDAADRARDIRLSRPSRSSDIYTELDVLGHQRLLRLVRRARAARSPTARGSTATSTACTPTIPNQALVITEFGAEANRSGPVDREGHVRVPVGLPAIPPGRLRLEAVRQRRADLEPARLPGQARLGRRQPAPATRR